jgi:selenocysteine-specific translation elongation factor
MSGMRIGHVNHFYDQISVAVILLTETISKGDHVHFLGRSTDFRQEVKSLQINHQPVEQASSGQEVALKVDQRVHPHDKVFKILEEE